MTASEVEFEFGVKFPTSSPSKTKIEKSSTKKRNLKLPPIPRGSNTLPRVEEVLITRGNPIDNPESFSMRKATVYNYVCPSNVCEFVVRRSLNKEGAYKTLETHMRIDHRKSK